MAMKVTIDEKKGQIHMVADIEEPLHQSKSGKSVLLLTTSGTTKLQGVTYKGHPVSANINLTLPNPGNTQAPATEE